MNKKRQIIFDKYNGKCAYCGCELQKLWHIDHIEPIVRRLRSDGKIMDEIPLIIDEDSNLLLVPRLNYKDNSIFIS